MGKLETTIILHDQFSDRLKKINSSINSTVKKMQGLQMAQLSSTELLRYKELEVAHAKQQTLQITAKQQQAEANRGIETQKTLRQQIGLERDKQTTIQATIRQKEREGAVAKQVNLSQLNAEQLLAYEKIKLAQQEQMTLRKTNAIRTQGHQTLMQQLGAWATKLRNIATIYFGIKSAIMGINKVVQMSDKMTNADARLNLVAGGDKKAKNDLELKSFAAAQRSTTDYLEFTKAVSKMGILAGDKFKNNDSIVRFVELMNKSFQISGAETSERQAAMLQITQAIASNRLQGDEFRSILENAPMVMDALNKSLGVTQAELKKMASEGQITADVLIKAMFDAGAKIEDMYKTLPMTWERHWAKLKNVYTVAFKPIQEQFKRLFNSKQFAAVMNAICTAMIVLGNVAGWVFKEIFNLLGWVANGFQTLKNWVSQASGVFLFLRDVLISVGGAILAVASAWAIYKGVQMAVVAWSKLQFVWTKLVTAAQWVHSWAVAICTAMLNRQFLWTKLLTAAQWLHSWAVTVGTTLMNIFTGKVKLASLAIQIFGLTINWIVALAVVGLALLIYWFYKTSDGWIDAVSRIVGAVYWCGEAISSTWSWLLDWLGTAFDNIGIAFSNSTRGMRELWWKWVQDCLNGAKPLVELINNIAEVFGKKGFNVQTWVAGKISDAQAPAQAYKQLPKFSQSVTSEKLNAAYNKGYKKSEKALNSIGDKLEDLKKVTVGGEKLTADALNGLSDSVGDGVKDIGSNTGDTAKNTGETAKNTSSEQDYSYLRNWAYQAGMGSSIGYNIKIEQNNKNNIGSNMDLNRVIDAVRDAIIEGITIQAEGV